MILFITAYDDATKDNFYVGQDLTYNNQRNLFIQNATRSSLVSAIERNTLPLFIMSHGDLTFLKDNDGNIALDTNDTHLLAGRTTYAWACHTSTSLGKIVCKEGGTWFGYTGPIRAPSEIELNGKSFTRIFQLILNRFPIVITEAEAIDFIDYIKTQCNELEELLQDQALEGNEEIDLLGCLSCCLHIWDRLRIWLPNNDPNDDEPRSIYHPDCAKPIFLMSLD